MSTRHPYAEPGESPTMYAPEFMQSAQPPRPSPPQRPKRFGWVAASLFALGGLALGGLGSLSDDSAPPVASPTATVTTTAPAEEVEKTPQSCLDALDYADEGFGIAVKVISYMEPAIMAVYRMDTAKMEQITGKITKATAKINKLGPKYQEAKAECRATR